MILTVLLAHSLLGVKPTLCALNGGAVCLVTPPTACPISPLDGPGKGARFDCTIIDVRLRVPAALGPPPAPAVPDDNDYGLLVRFIVPGNRTKSGTGTPLLMHFHGTGSCGLDKPAAEESCACSPDIPCSVADGCKQFVVASEGVLVARPAERGTMHCYNADDPMTDSATWLGALEFQDYDVLISAILAGTIDPHLPRDVDATRIGVTGGSHGGLASFLYPVASSHATATSPFALSMPFEGTPDVGASWFRWQYDLDTINATGVPAIVGFAPNAGAKSQLDAFPGSALTKILLAAFASGDQGPLVQFLGSRSAYDRTPSGDGGRTLDTLNTSVSVFFIHTGGRDCIVPGYGPIEAWEILRSSRYDRPNDVWLFDNYPHSCSATGPRLPTELEEADLGGYTPFWSASLLTKTDAISSSLWVNFVRRYLLLRPEVGVGVDVAPVVLPQQPVVAATVAHDADTVAYKALSSTLAAEVDGVETLYLHAGTLVLAKDRVPAGSGAPVAVVLTSQTAATIAKGCPTLSIDTPCGLSWAPKQWRASLATLMTMWSHVTYRYTFTEKKVLIGAPVFSAQLRLEGADGGGFQGAGLNVALMYTPPPTAGSAATNTSKPSRWFLTQGMATFDHVDTATGERTATIELDDRLFVFEAGGVLELVLSNLSPGLVHHFPWVNPIMYPFQAHVLLGGANVLQASLSLPTSNQFETIPAMDTKPWETPYWFE